MIVYKVTVREHFHAKLTGEFVTDLSKFPYDFELHFKNYIVDAKSILGVISLGLTKGDTVKIMSQSSKLDRTKALEVAEVIDKYFSGIEL